jgi:hypothetical protein
MLLILVVGRISLLPLDGVRVESSPKSATPMRGSDGAFDHNIMASNRAQDSTSFSTVASTEFSMATEVFDSSSLEWETFEISNPILEQGIKDRIGICLSDLRLQHISSGVLGVADAQHLVSDLLAVLRHAIQDSTSTSELIRMNSLCMKENTGQLEHKAVLDLWQSRIQSASGFRINSTGM